MVCSRNLRVPSRRVKTSRSNDYSLEAAGLKKRSSVQGRRKMSQLTPQEEKILSTNPRPIIITGLVLIIVFFGGLLAWAAFLPFYGAVIAPGTVKVSENKKVVQHLEGGIVDKIFVREG